MATAGSTSKDARRRRITERGSDRLALITGRIQTLQPSSSFPSPKPTESPLSSLHSYQASCPPVLSDQSTPDFQEGENRDPNPSLQKCESNPESGQLNNIDGRAWVRPYERNCETSIEASKPSPLQSVDEVQSIPGSSTVQDPLISNPTKEPQFDTKTYLGQIFTPNQISSAVAASERIRVCCSFVAAILVVLSYIGFPILGSHAMRSIFISRPLFLLILTNISIVVALLLVKQEGKGRVKQERKSFSVPPVSGNGMFDHLGFALKWGFVLQKVVGALFMDCSVYAVVIVCSLSLAYKLGL